MSKLQDQLGAAVDLDALRFDGREFAEDRFGSVRGRIARRRAARSAGISGVSVLGAGVVAVGAGQVPWSGFVFGSPGSSPTVVCTTTTPEAVVADGVSMGHTWVVETEAGTQVYEVFQEGEYLVVKSNAGADRISPDEDGSYRFTVDGQEVVWSVQDDGELSVVTVDFEGSAEVTTVPSTSPAAPEPSPSPVVTCVTTTPEPSESASPSIPPSAPPSGSPSASPSASAATSSSPSAEPSRGSEPGVPWAFDSANPTNTPFQCGFEFPGESGGTSDFSVTTDVMTSTEARAAFVQRAETFIPELVAEQPVWQVAWTERPSSTVAYDGAQTLVLDPMDERYTPNEDTGVWVHEGIAFVAVVDGRVVATLDPQGVVEPDGSLAMLPTSTQLPTAYLWDLDALTACAEFTGDVADAEIYGVGGFYSTADESVGYAWERVEE